MISNQLYKEHLDLQ